MKTENAPIQLLSEYKKPEFSIHSTELFFELNPDQTQVKSRLKMSRTSTEAQPLVLHGVDLDIRSISINQRLLEPSEYQYDQNELVIDDVPDEFIFEASVVISPVLNTRFEGLYVSSGNFCTQCEAEGFRHITFYLDRPDVMSIFTTTITANKADYPVLLSNGHRTEYRETDTQHTAVWQDPFHKPAYLFALVAGDLSCVKGTFTTRTGRTVDLEFYTEAHNVEQCDHALVSLQKAMKWDEDTFGLEYDLDLYMVVAVDDFNMGAMENKGLNVFNTKYVLASQQTATDQDYLNIEGVIGHEYFHNWTGNRVTCRDWFQLSLKEGLTVFRDQEFSSDLNSRGIQRISDVSVLRAHQFAEDASPMSHPVRPNQYQQINNFYTATVYNKGAEVVRMMQCIIGDDNFKKGIDLYFQRFDGQAVTTDDFRQVMQDVSGVNLDQFQRWYEQSGTPQITLTREYNASTKQLSLNISQQAGASKDVENKAFHIPIRVALFNAQGEALAMASGEFENVLNLTEMNQTFHFENIDEGAIPSILRGFSAPVKVVNDLSAEEKLVLMAHDTDAFNRWDAAQQIASDILLELIDQDDSQLIQNYVKAVKSLLEDEAIDPALCAELLQLPSAKYIAELMDVINPHAIHQARETLKQHLASSLTAQFKACYDRTRNESSEFAITPQAMGMRALNNACLNYLVLLETEDHLACCASHYHHANNMTDRMGALNALRDSSCSLKTELYEDFYARFEHDNLVIDKWFSLQAVSSAENGLQTIQQLLEHPAFTLKNPNRARSLVGAFAHSGSIVFHQTDGSGYALIAQQLLLLDALNPQVGARLAGALIHWKKLVEPLSSLLKATIEDLLKHDSLSLDVREILQSSMD